MLLSICIPTYNRSEKVYKLLNFLEREIKEIKDLNIQFEIIVGDNSSDNLTQDICLKTQLYQQNKLTYIKNESNIGLVGNVLSLANKANGEYVWIIGDDDIYINKILSFIKDAILEDDYAYIFLNHRAYIEGKIGSSGFDSAVDLSKGPIYENGKQMAIDIWNHSQTSLMFLSASVYKKEALKKCLLSNKKIDLAYPLYMSLFSPAQGKSKIIKEICIDNVWGDTSWSKSSFEVFHSFVPSVLYSLPNIGYSYIDARIMLMKYIRPKIKGVLTLAVKKYFTSKNHK